MPRAGHRMDHARQCGGFARLLLPAHQRRLPDPFRAVFPAVPESGKDVDEETAAKCAAQCAVNAIAAIKSLIGDLDKVVRVVKVVGFVASTPDFTKQPVVINGASDLFIQAFGDAGKHARSAVGVAALPANTPVEVEVIVEVRD